MGEVTMQTTQPMSGETQSLRRCVRELAALSAVSAAWSQSAPREIADGLGSAICRTLPVAFVYIRVSGPAGQPAIEVAHTHRGPIPARQAHEIGRKLQPLLKPGNPDQPPAIANPFGSGTLRLAIRPLGCDGDCGVLVAGSPQPDFPDETDQLLLGFAANQAAMVLQRQQTEEALRRSERELADFFENATVGLHWVGPDGIILRANRAELNLLGYSADEYVGHHVAEFHADKDVICEILRRLHAGEELRDFEARLRCKDGSVKHVVISSSVLWEDGKFVHTRCFTRDITDRKRAEEAVRRQTDLFTTLVEHIPDIVSRLDRDLRFLYISPAVCTMTGRPAHEYIGKPRTNEGIPPEFAQARERLSRKVFETGQEHSLEFPIQTQSGERLLECRLIPEFAPDGSVESLMTLTRDVTERKRAEEALRESEERWRFMAESMPQKIFTATPSGAVDYLNRQWTDFTGLPAEQIKGWGWIQLVHPDDMEQTATLWKESIEAGEPLRCVHRFRRGDGAYRWHLSRAQAMRDSAGTIVMWIGSNTDIHEEKETEAELRRANADLEQFAYSASHDLQEPIRNVAVYSEILARRYSDVFDERGRQYLQFIASGAQRMGMLVKDLLAYTKIAGMEEEPSAEVDAVSALGKAISNLSEAVRETGADIAHNGLPTLRVREVQLEQLFQNLIGNAIKYRKEEEAPRIQVEAEREGACWRIAVKDNGIGIPPEHRQRVFGIFKRLHNEERYSGTGIGLAICQRIVERNGGRIWVESEGPGTGSTFFFTLPAADSR